MEVENSVSSSVDSGSPSGGMDSSGAPVATPAAAESQSVDAGASSQSVDAPAAPAYTPNYKYKVLDSEKEFPEWAKGLIKDAELEKNVRDLFAKADGLDHIKTRRDSLENENKTIKEQWGPLVQNYQTVAGYLQKGDLDSFFEAAGIPELELFKYVNKRLQLRENPSELKAYETTRELARKNEMLEQQVQQFSTQQQQAEVERYETEFSRETGRPEVSSFIQSWEAQAGQPGAFRAEVIRRGLAYAAEGKTITPTQAVQEVLSLMGWKPQGVANPMQTMQPNAQDLSATPQVQAKPTLPNIRGKGTSPAKTVPRSLADLQKLAKEKRLAGE